MVVVNVAHGDQPVARFTQMPVSHAADADDALRELIAGRREPLSAQHMPGNDREQTGCGRLFEECTA